MNYAIEVSCDSACDLIPALQEKYGIGITHMYVHEGDQTFRDGVDITPENIYATFEQKGVLPRTSAIPPEEYYDFFKERTDRGAAVIHISLSSGISSTHQNARIAAERLPDVYVIDSEALSCSGGLLAVQACEMREKGMSAEEIVRAIQAAIPLTSTSFIVGSLTFLAKGGRCNSVTAFGANLLGIKPAVEMSDGVLSVGKKYRGKIADCFHKFLNDKIEQARETSDGGDAVLYEAGIDPELFASLVQELEESGIFRRVLTNRAGSVISSHCGRQTIGFTYQKTGL